MIQRIIAKDGMHFQGVAPRNGKEREITNTMDRVKGKEVKVEDSDGDDDM